MEDANPFLMFGGCLLALAAIGIYFWSVWRYRGHDYLTALLPAGSSRVYRRLLVVVRSIFALMVLPYVLVGTVVFGVECIRRLL